MFLASPSRRIFAFVLAGCLCAALPGCASAPKSKADQTPAERAQLFLQMGSTALLEGDPTGALENLFEARRLGLDSAELRHGLALAYHAKGEAQAALDEARRAVAMKPGLSEANSTLGKLLMDHGRNDEALPYLRKAAKDPLYRESFKPLTSIGIIHYRKGELSQSRLHLDRAIQSARTSACVAYYYRGHLNLRESRPTDAIHDYEMASKNVCAGFGDAHVALALAYEKLRENEKARKKFLEIQQLFPSTPYSAQAIAHLQNLP
ncbi:MAG: tetratricopeptide repeat protein [Oligoflexia bacterium]|nr:tetratricopeptide repeat protein [Oligoflexia bacterium]